ncbi:hypothetical protein DUI87_16560 [Hirundo rustica rustica]|uniref:RRM domain-containing protein n=1 Tax=Hirundo rustica rustica TaxID=333673 RepID=A0A3M0K732_HIRRU|nr:hypothetical protein DUI87_16560 [Hirundo rustica rustica]
MNNLGMVPVGLAGQQLVTASSKLVNGIITVLIQHKEELLHYEVRGVPFGISLPAMESTPVTTIADHLANSICVPGFDPSLSMMTGITPINPMIPGMGLVPPPPPTDVPVVKEIIHCKSCTLFPPNPNLPPPSTRERPPGCKTVFVGGLPENATEEIIQEVFEQCGDITAIRKSKKNFCHIRFAEEFMVDKAIYLSGYRMRLGSSTDKKDSGRLHVDFAQARDDFYEWECKQRMLAREERHRRKMEEDRLRPPSPPAIMHYSEHEAALLAEKLKDDSKFSEAITVLLTWIERGEVNRRSANQFYSMVQSANSHVRRLMNEKAAHEQEMEQAKESFKNALTGILTQCYLPGRERRGEERRGEERRGEERRGEREERRGEERRGEERRGEERRGEERRGEERRGEERRGEERRGEERRGEEREREERRGEEGEEKKRKGKENRRKKTYLIIDEF